MKNNTVRAWMNIALLVLINCVGYGLISHSGSLYIVPICESLSITRFSFSITNTLSTCVGFVLSLALAKVLNILKDVKKLIIIGSLAGIVALFIFSSANSVSTLYVGGAIRGMFMTFTNISCMSILVTKWFTSNKATVMGLVAAGTGLGGTLFSPIVNTLITNFGWRSSYLLSALILAAVTVPVVVLLKEAPDEAPADSLDSLSNIPTTTELRGVTVQTALKSSYFWLGLAGMFLVTSSISLIYPNIAAILTEKNLLPTIIPIVLSVQYLSNTIAKIGIGFSLDKLGIQKTIAAILIFFAAACTCLLFSQYTFVAFLYALLFGIGFTIMSSPISAIVESLFGLKEYSRFVGYFMAATQLGSIIAPLIASKVFDTTGSYQLSIIGAIVLCALAFFFILSALKLSKKHNRNST